MNKLRVILMCVSMSMVSTQSQAAEHELQWSAAVRAEHVDNVFLSARQKDFLASSIFSPTLSYRRLTPLWQGSVTAFTNLRRTSDPSFDTNDKRYSGSLSRVWERASVDVQVARDDATVRQIELVETLRVSNDPVTTDTAVISSRYQLSTTQSVSGNARHLQRDYAGNNFTDYTDWRVDGTWQNSLSNTLATQIQLYYSEYASDRADLIFDTSPRIFSSSENTSETLGAQAGVFGSLSARISYNLLAGTGSADQLRNSYFYLDNPEQTRFRAEQVSSRTTSSVFAATLRYTGEKLQFNLDSNKQLQASGNGFQYDTLTVNLNGSYRMSQFWSANAGLAFTDQNAVNALQRQNLDRKLLVSRAGINWRMSQLLWLSATVSHAAQKYDASPDTAESLTGVVQFRFTPDPIRL